MTLDQLIQEAVLRDGLDGLTLWPTLDGQWQANARRSTNSWQVEIDADPVTALRAVLAPRSGTMAGATDEGVFG